MLILFSYLQSTEAEGILYKLFYEVSITLMLKPDKTFQEKETIDQYLSWMSFSKILLNAIQWYINSIIHPDIVGFILDM